MTAQERLAGGHRPPTVVGLDIGGTATRAVVLQGTEVLASRVMSTPTDPDTALAVLVAWIGDMVHDAGLREGALAGIGIGASGPIDADGVIRNPDTLMALTGLDLMGTLQDDFSVPVTVENDAATAAVAEFHVGAGQGARSMLVVTLGTGVGVALVRDGELFRGGDGLHPEGDHLTVPGEAAPCYCGRRTCLEQTASRAALQRHAQQVCGTGDLVELAAAASRDDAGARRVMDDYGRRVADGLVELCTQHRPDLVVLAGSAAAHLPHYRTPLEAALAAMTTAPMPRVLATTLGDPAGAIGAALLVGDLLRRRC